MPEINNDHWRSSLNDGQGMVHVLYPDPSIKRSVIFATPFYELKGFSPYITSLVESIKLLTLAGIESYFWRLDGCAYLTHGKNFLLTKFLQSTATDIFMIDSDMAWEPRTVADLLMRDELIIGVPYKQRGTEQYGARFVSDADKGEKIREAQWVGGGLMRIRREAVEKFVQCYPDRKYKYGKEEYICFFECNSSKFWACEDAMFCFLMRDIGVKVYYWTDATISHFAKSPEMVGNYYIDEQKGVLNDST